MIVSNNDSTTFEQLQYSDLRVQNFQFLPKHIELTATYLQDDREFYRRVLAVAAVNEDGVCTQLVPIILHDGHLEYASDIKGYLGLTGGR